MIKVLMVLSLCSLALSLKCYDCNPKDTNECKSPASNNIKATDCAQDEECFALHFEVTADTTSLSGIYRGCALPQKNSTCSYSIAGVTGVVKSCRTCTDDLCNYGSPDGAASVTISLITLILSAVTCIYFSSL